MGGNAEDRLTRLEEASRDNSKTNRELVAVVHAMDTDIKLIAQATATMQQAITQLTDVVKEQHEQDKRISSIEGLLELTLAKQAELAKLPDQLHEQDKRIAKNEGAASNLKSAITFLSTVAAGVAIYWLTTGAG